MVTEINKSLNQGMLSFQSGLHSMKQKCNVALDKALMKYDAWFLVLTAVIMCLALVVTTGLAVWCLVYKGKKFTGAWNWTNSGVSVNVECK